MTYQERLALFLMYADKYGLQIIKPKYKPDDGDKSWAN